MQKCKFPSFLMKKLNFQVTSILTPPSTDGRKLYFSLNQGNLVTSRLKTEIYRCPNVFMATCLHGSRVPACRYHHSSFCIASGPITVLQAHPCDTSIKKMYSRFLQTSLSFPFYRTYLSCRKQGVRKLYNCHSS